MASIADATAKLLAFPAPVLLIDTCSLVDIIRAPKRAAQLRDCVRSAAELRRMTTTDPVGCHLIVGSFVAREWLTHAEPTRLELERHLKTLNEEIAQYQDACLHAGVTSKVGPVLRHIELPEALHRLSIDLLNCAVHLEEEDGTNLRAFARAAHNVPPSRKGGEIKDSTILEECLELCRRLRAGGFSRRLVYCTSNTADYCERNMLHSRIKPDFDATAIDFVTSLPWAVASLKH